MPATCDCRLLCASTWGYSIAHSAELGAAPPYDQALGCASKPVCFARGLHDINACLIGTNDDGVIIAFRGTQPPDSPDREQVIVDWFNDFHAELIAANNMPGRVHAGFWGALDSLWQPLRDELMARLKAASKPPKVYITGHSKGGGIAPLAAMRLAVEEGVLSTVRTFAAPHAADEDFAAAYNAKITDSVRYEYADDIVPHVPPSLAFRQMFWAVPFFQSNPAVADRIRRFDLNYTSVGRLRYVRNDGSVMDDTHTLRFERFASLVKRIASGQFEEIVNDHSSRCGAGYMRGVCPPEMRE